MQVYPAIGIHETQDWHETLAERNHVSLAKLGPIQAATRIFGLHAFALGGQRNDAEGPDFLGCFGHILCWVWPSYTNSLCQARPWCWTSKSSDPGTQIGQQRLETDEVLFATR